VEKNRVDPFLPLNSILIFRCYHSISKRKETGIIDKDLKIIYNQRRYMGKMEARGDLAAIKLTTRIADSQKVEFPTNLFGLPF